MAIPQLSNIYLKGDKCKDKNLSWAENPAAQKLLDAIVSILAEEYIEIAKQNPKVFMDSRFRGNDNVKGDLK